jgi:hypothetical protein
MTGYLHWRRFDWSFNSICITCSATIANAKEEADLGEYECTHVCNPECLTEQGELASRMLN